MGFESLSYADLKTVVSAFRRGRPVAPELAPALLAYCGIRERNRRQLWISAVVAVCVAIGGTALLLGHVAHADFRGAILIAVAFAFIVAAAWQLQRLPRQISEAELHAQASLAAQQG